MKRLYFCLCCLAMVLSGSMFYASACTGIALRAKDGSRVVARTVEWAKEPMNCGYVVVPVGYEQRSLTPIGEEGMKFKATFGYVGIYTEYEKFVVEGVNEAGLSAGLFFFPGFGEYPEFDDSMLNITLCDMQLVSWALSKCASIDEVICAISEVRITNLDSRVGTVHWRFSEPGGRVVVLEYKDGQANFYENPLGTLTNAPGFDFHITNLRNYVNLRPGAAEDMLLGQTSSCPHTYQTLERCSSAPVNDNDVMVMFSPLGGGSGMLGLPGDFTPPSRFVRAALFSTSAPICETGFETVNQAFHILNNFDIPIGAQHPAGQAPEGLPSATQFIAATDLAAMQFYYRTAWNQDIRCIDLNSINFKKVKYQTAPLDKEKFQPVQMVKIR